MAKPTHRDVILEAGLKSFHRKGYHATSVQDVVELAGVPKGSFYNHFDSKEKLGMAVIDHYWNSAAPIREILLNQSPVPQRVDQHLQALGCPEEGCLLGNFTAELASEDPFRLHLAGVWKLWQKALANCLREGQEAGSIRRNIPADDLAQFVLAQWEGAMLAYRIDRNPSALEKCRQMIQAMIKA
jgi:TetR/AcrR family transcriptional repressor of nem operon